MIIEIRGVGFANKGAELMLNAVSEEVARWPEAELAISPASGAYRQRAALGLLQKFAPARLGRLGSAAGNLLPQKIRAMYGIVNEAEISAVLDAAGFAYSDQWGPLSSERLAVACRRWRGQGKSIVLLPQAFGPFRTGRTREAFKKVLDEVDLVFARDATSAEYLAELGQRRASVKRSPDFTVAVSGRESALFNARPGLIAVIPNYRMIDKGSGNGNYTELLVALVQHARRQGFEPFLLVHDLGADRHLATRIAADVEGNVPIIIEPDPIALKGILGSCHAIVASRFHAIIGAMTQGVPALGTGWSHKYEELFKDFGCADALCNVEAPLGDILARFDALLEGRERTRALAELERTSRAYLEQTEVMWKDVAAVINGGVAVTERCEP